MIPKHAVLILCALMILASQAFGKSKAILPEGCGDDSVQFDVTQEKDNPTFAAPPEGKAVIVFSESMPGEQKMKTTTRFGVDGSWAGATKGDSYFTVTVDPGEHNVCASMQSAPSRAKKQFTQLATLTAEAGKVYYFEAAVNVIGTANLAFATFSLGQLSDADGKYRLRAWKFATSKAKK